MTAKEKLRVAVEELSETEAADALDYIASCHRVEGDALDERGPTRHRLGFVAIGESTSGRTAAEAEELLAEGFGR
jgi:hypothetical protein